MIEIYAQDSFIVIKPFSTNSPGDAVRIYNCYRDSRYATGLDGNLPIQELSDLLERTKASENEFLAGIYEKSSGADSKTVLRFAGLCSGIVDACTVWIKKLTIVPESRRKGIGTKAVEMILKYAVQSHNVQDVYLSVVEKNTAGLCFWKKLGFCEAHRIEKVLFGEDCPSNVIIMHKNL